jgi:hypothetical protein
MKKGRPPGRPFALPSTSQPIGRIPQDLEPFSYILWQDTQRAEFAMVTRRKGALAPTVP